MLPRDINKKFRANDSALTASSPADSTRQVSCIRDSECRVLPYDQQIAYRDRPESRNRLIIKHCVRLLSYELI